MEKVWDAIDKYNSIFEDGFPTIPLLNQKGEGVISIIEDCINQNKDVYELGYLELDDDIIY